METAASKDYHGVTEKRRSIARKVEVRWICLAQNALFFDGFTATCPLLVLFLVRMPVRAPWSVATDHPACCTLTPALSPMARERNNNGQPTTDQGQIPCDSRAAMFSENAWFSQLVSQTSPHRFFNFCANARVLHKSPGLWKTRAVVPARDKLVEPGFVGSTQIKQEDYHD